MTDTDAPAESAGKRNVWGWIGWAFDRIWVGVVYATFVFMFFAGLILGYDDLTDPHCDGQLMGPGQLCSVLDAGQGRSEIEREHLNPAGSAPVALTLPGYKHPEKIWRAVYNGDQMRSYHRSYGLFGLAMAALPVAIAVTTWLRGRKAKRATATAAEVDDTQTGTGGHEAPSAGKPG